MKILLYATHPAQPIGYGKIAYKLSQFLVAQPDVELHYFAISAFPETAIKRDIDPRINFIDAVAEERALGNDELYGVNVIAREIERVKPDVFIIYNDIIVTCRLMNALLDYRSKNKYTTICYIDLVYPFEKLEFIRHMNRNCDYIWAFSECWKRNMIDMGIAAEKITIVPHGYDDSLAEIDMQAARRKLSLSETDFIVLNTNRNAYRKAWDITIRAFLLFLKRNYMNPLIKLFINCHLNTREGYDILQIIETECVRLSLDFNTVTTKHILQVGSRVGYVEDEIINNIYCCANIGINTCVGEGFGLCNMEQGRLGIAQVVTRTGGLGDIFSKGGALLVEPATSIMVSNGLDGHNGYIDISRAEDFAEALDIYYKHPERRIADGKFAREHIIRKYNWDVILSGVWAQLSKLH